MPNRKDFTVIPGGKSNDKYKPQFHRGGKRIVPVNDTKNEELLQALEVYEEKHSMESLDAVGDALKNARVMVPVISDGKELNPFPACLKTQDNEMLIPVFSGKEELLKAPKTEAAMNIKFMDICQMAIIAEGVSGIVVNPFSHNLMLRKAFLELLKNDEHIRDQKIAKENEKEMQLTEEQINQVERYRFETKNLPEKFFLSQSLFVKQLLKEKEEFIDSLFEESYVNARLYPYRTDEFLVSVIQPEEETKVIRLDMPKRNLCPGTAKSIFFVIKNKELSYYSLSMNEKKTYSLFEISTDLKVGCLLKSVPNGTEFHEIMKLKGLDF